MADGTCSVDGCEKQRHYADGLCGMHYQRFRRHGSLGVPPRKASKPRGLCSIEGCGQPHQARGWCKKHHNRWLRHGDPMFALKRRDRPPEERVCRAPDCGQSSHCGGLCSMHYSRLGRHGSLSHPHPRNRAPTGMHWCSLCGTYKPADEFAANRNRKLGLADDCKACHRRYPSWSIRHPEESKARARQFRRSHPDLISLYNHRRRAYRKGRASDDYTPTEIAERDGWRCGICGAHISRDLGHPHPRSLSIDHIVPYAAGGDDTRANVQASHLTCNVRKNVNGTDQLRLFG